MRRNRRSSHITQYRSSRTCLRANHPPAACWRERCGHHIPFSPHTTTMSQPVEAAAVDLTSLLSCLSRDELELALVHAISRYPSLYDRLLRLLSKPVDTATISSSLASLLSFTTSPSSLTPELEPHIEQAGDYVKCGRVRGAVEVLTCVSEAVVGWVRQVRRGRESEMDDEYHNLESLFGLLVSHTSHLQPVQR